jgi:TIR domain
MISVFVSHSSQDRQLAELLVDLLRSALNLGADTIRATSVDGYRLPGGADVDDQLRDELLGAPVFIGVLSPLSLSSAYVLLELGARWGGRRQLIPLLAPGMNAHALQGPIVNLNALSCESPSQLHQLVLEVGNALGVEAESPAVYQSKVDALAYYGVGGAPHAVDRDAPARSPREAKAISSSGQTDGGGPPEQEDYSNADAIIHLHCEKEWPTDFSMRAYCMDQQREALAQLQKGAPEGVPLAVFTQIRARCAAEWPDDYSMRAYCEGQQVAGYRAVSDR